MFRRKLSSVLEFDDAAGRNDAGARGEETRRPQPVVVQEIDRNKLAAPGVP
jgi:hypothetical protein